jgi:Spy/CpxP family protein refolding chaperone
MERELMGGPPGRWWKNPDMIQKLALTADQQKKIDDIFQESRLKLIDLNAALQKDEAVMEPLLDADQPDEGKILAQIDRVAQGRAELEKANARMLLGIRRTLTAEQWKKLSAEAPPPPAHDDRPGRGGPQSRPGGPPRDANPPNPPAD